MKRDERGGDGMSRFGGRMRWAAVALVAAATLTACAGLGEAGAAWTVGSAQVSTDLLAAQVEAVQEQRGETPGAPDNALVVGILQRLIITELVGQAATAQNITITQGQIDGAQAELEAQLGGAEALTAAFLDSDVPAGSIPQQLQLSLEVQALGGVPGSRCRPGESATRRRAVRHGLGCAGRCGGQSSLRYLGCGQAHPRTDPIGLVVPSRYP